MIDEGRQSYHRWMRSLLKVTERRKRHDDCRQNALQNISSELTLQNQVVAGRVQRRGLEECRRL